MNIWSVVAVGAGAAVGAWLRWGLIVALNPLFVAIPAGTLAANLVGGYLIGMMLGLVHAMPELPANVRLFAITGLLGGLTTFSTFSAEVFQLLQKQDYGWAFALVALHLVGSLAMTALGWLSFGALRT